MPDDVIEYRSEFRQVTNQHQVLDVSETEGLKCTWSGQLLPVFQSRLTFQFEWGTLKTQPIYRIYGQITIFANISGRGMQTTVTNIEMRSGEEQNSFDVEVELRDGHVHKHMVYEYKVYVEPNYEEMLSSRNGNNDTMLMVEGREVWVNKEFLSYHSDYFRAFFAEHWNQNVNGAREFDLPYQEFGLMLSMIYPENRYPNDFTFETLLLLADRFLLPTITQQVERHLRFSSELEIEHILSIAEREKFPKVVKKRLGELYNKYACVNVMESQYFRHYSDDLKRKIMEKYEKFGGTPRDMEEEEEEEEVVEEMHEDEEEEDHDHEDQNEQPENGNME
ncbi:unnamed protein product [Caenorhabditis brenneri]